MDFIRVYRGLPKPLRQQLARFQELEILEHCGDKKAAYRHLYKRYLASSRSQHPSVKKAAQRMALLQTLTPRDLMLSPLIKELECYRESKHQHKHHDSYETIELSKTIKVGRHACVAKGRHNGRKVVVKYYQSSKQDITYEIGIYQRLRRMGCKLPQFEVFFCWGQPVLVLEWLKQITDRDDEYKLARHVIKQLTYLHSFGVHCDIKPGNVMRRGDKYLVIDYGGIAKDPLGHGYRRWLWSPRWTSQVAHEKNQITTPKYDLIELGYTMKTIQDMRKGRSNRHCREGFHGRLKTYMERVSKINERKVRSRDYHDLLQILRKGTT